MNEAIYEEVNEEVNEDVNKETKMNVNEKGKVCFSWLYTIL